MTFGTGIHPRAATSGENDGGKGRLGHQIRPRNRARHTIAPLCRNYNTRIVSEYINILKISFWSGCRPVGVGNDRQRSLAPASVLTASKRASNTSRDCRICRMPFCRFAAESRSWAAKPSRLSSRWSHESVAETLQTGDCLLEIADTVVGVVKEARPSISDYQISLGISDDVGGKSSWVGKVWQRFDATQCVCQYFHVVHISNRIRHILPSELGIVDRLPGQQTREVQPPFGGGREEPIRRGIVGRRGSVGGERHELRHR